MSTNETQENKYEANLHECEETTEHLKRIVTDVLRKLKFEEIALRRRLALKQEEMRQANEDSESSNFKF